jgi:hypothetical protein
MQITKYYCDHCGKEIEDWKELVHRFNVQVLHPIKSDVLDDKYLAGIEDFNYKLVDICSFCMHTLLSRMFRITDKDKRIELFNAFFIKESKTMVGSCKS